MCPFVNNTYPFEIKLRANILPMLSKFSSEIGRIWYTLYMNILIISPGKKHSPEMAALIGEYEKRLGGRFDVSWKFIPAGDIKDECAAILKALQPDDFVILLDEKGSAVTSVQFSKMLEPSAVSSSKRIVFVIGGAYGVDDSVRSRARKTVSLSAMTLPHMIVRLLLVEQIYRASEIIRGGKYHHA